MTEEEEFYAAGARASAERLALDEADRAERRKAAEERQALRRKPIEDRKAARAASLAHAAKIAEMQARVDMGKILARVAAPPAAPAAPPAAPAPQAPVAPAVAPAAPVVPEEEASESPPAAPESQEITVYEEGGRFQATALDDEIEAWGETAAQAIERLQPKIERVIAERAARLLVEQASEREWAAREMARAGRKREGDKSQGVNSSDFGRGFGPSNWRDGGYTGSGLL